MVESFDGTNLWFDSRVLRVLIVFWLLESEYIHYLILEVGNSATIRGNRRKICRILPKWLWSC